MKNFFLILFFILYFTTVKSQTYYKAVLSELYTYNSITKNWNLYQKNSDVNIPIIVETSFITIQALSPSMYKIYDESKRLLTTSTFNGYSYTAKNLKTEQFVKIDILRYNDSNIILLSIIDEDKSLNYRFFLNSD